MDPTRTRTSYDVISADTHVLEPADLWTSRIDARHRDRVPRIEWLEQGGAWVMEGCPQPISFGWTMAAGRAPADLTDWLTPDQVKPELWGDPANRLAIQDADRIDAEILFPNRPFQGVVGNTDADLHNAMVRIYNDWLSEFCAYAPSRLGGVAAIPNRGVAEAVKEVERAAQLPGIVGFLLNAYPHGGTSIRDEDDPVFEAVAATGKPLAIHIMLSDGMPFQIDAGTLPGAGHFYDCPGRMLEIIFSRLLDRVPNLNIVFHEVDCGWIPYFLDQADDNYLRHAKATLKDQNLAQLPSEYVRERFAFSFIHDTVAIANRHTIGVQRMLWSNDYPHIASDWPASWKNINSAFASVPADERHAMVAGNALRLYGFGSS
ncbi:MAG TPA: amidohydrolase family protein [Candidatus Dormibacteraeota bacterium]|nr:amidohydrolase family protein [Candidatus Dormibacteraeota bacterium]